MKYFFLFVFATLILNAEYEVKKINSKKTYSLTYGSGKIVAGAEDGLYYTDTNTTTVFVRNANFQEKKVTMVRFVNNIFFAGVVDIININSGLPLQCNLSVGKEFSRLYSSNNLSDWNLKFNGTFGECSQYHFSDIAFFGNNYFFSLRLTKESTGGNIYKHDGNNLDTKPCREGNFLIDYYEFYDIEIHNDKLYFAAQPYKDNLQDNSTDGSIMTQENCNWTGNLGIEYSIYSLESFQGNLFAGGKDSNGEGVIFKTDGVNPQKNGSGWENVLTQSFFNPVKAIESTDSLLFVGLEDGAILLSKNLGQTYNLKKYNEFSGAINEMLFVKEVNYLYIAADYGLFYIDLNNVPKYKISGTVTDCDTKSDLSGVKVELKDNDNKTIGTKTTNVDGSYSFENLTSAYYNLVFSKIGYEDKLSFFELVNDIDWDICLNKTPATTYEIYGTITDCANGKELVNVQVILKDSIGNRIDTTISKYKGYYVFEKYYKEAHYSLNFQHNNYESKDVSNFLLNKKMSINTCLNNISDTSKYILNIQVLDFCSDEPISGATVSIQDNQGGRNGTTDNEGKFSFIYGNSIANVIVTATHKDYYTKESNVIMTNNVTNFNISLEPKTYIPTLNLNLNGEQTIFATNDTIKISTSFSDNCVNSIIGNDDVSIYVEYDPLELYLINKGFHKQMNSKYYSDSLGFNDELHFLTLLGNKSSTDIIMHYDAYSGVANYEHSLYDTIKIYKQQPFYLQRKLGGIIKNVSPNPISNSFEIEYDITADDNYTISISNFTGEKILDLLNEQLAIGIGKKVFEIQLPNGAYFITIKSENSYDSYPIIIK